MEILDICDELGNPTGETVEREIAHQPRNLASYSSCLDLKKKRK